MKKNLRNILDILLAIAVSVLITSCHSTRNASSTPSGQDSAQWHDVYMPVKVNLSSPTSIGLSGRATMVRDSVINMSMRVFGIEVAVMNIDRDSVYLVDKFHKYIFAESKSKVLGSHDMSVGRIQALILGTGRENDPKLVFENAGLGTAVTVTFADFISTPVGQTAANITVNAPLRSGDVKASLRWDLQGARWDSGRNVTFTPPRSGYKRVSVEDALEMFKNL